MPIQPSWINKQLFPFESKSINIDGHAQHYIDEGSGDVILFVHGTPEWSFGFRDLVKELRKNFRCIAIDHLGFGLSDKPSDADYTVEAHSKRLTKFIQQLQLRNITIVANDFGGGIAIGYAVHHPGNVARIALFNTWLWSVRDDKHFSGPAKVIDSWLGRFMYRRLNAPVNFIMPSAFGNRKKLTPEIHRHYKKVVPDAASRVALYAIARQLMGASDWWDANWKQMSKLDTKPFLIFWGMKDKFIPPTQLEKLKTRLPKAKVVIFDDAGHFVQEEKELEMIAGLSNFMKS